jgi:cytochrome c oxidase assembly protein subunit 11
MCRTNANWTNNVSQRTAQKTKAQKYRHVRIVAGAYPSRLWHHSLADGVLFLMNANTKLAVNAAVLAVAMLGLAYASVPLYRLFCQVTGFGGTTQAGLKAPGAVGEKQITILFNADTGQNLNWSFKPGEREIKIKVGEQGLTHYVAENRDNSPVTGQATYNVVPHGAGQYFVKIHCFCFENQTLKPHQKVNMPVSFYVDPAILTDPEMKDISTITLSYTFFAQEK